MNIKKKLIILACLVMAAAAFSTAVHAFKWHLFAQNGSGQGQTGVSAGQEKQYLQLTMAGNAPFPLYLYSATGTALTQIAYISGPSQQVFLSEYETGRTNGSYYLYGEQQNGQWLACRIIIENGAIVQSTQGICGGLASGISNPSSKILKDGSTVYSNVYTVSIGAQPWTAAAWTDMPQVPPTPQNYLNTPRSITFVNNTQYASIKIGENCANSPKNPQSPLCTSTSDITGGGIAQKQSYQFVINQNPLYSAAFYVSAYQAANGNWVATGGFGTGERVYATQLEGTWYAPNTPDLITGVASVTATNVDISAVNGFSFRMSLAPTESTYCTKATPSTWSMVSGLAHAGYYGPDQIMAELPAPNSAGKTLQGICSDLSAQNLVSIPLYNLNHAEIEQPVPNYLQVDLSIMQNGVFQGCMAPGTYIDKLNADAMSTSISPAKKAAAVQQQNNLMRLFNIPSPQDLFNRMACANNQANGPAAPSSGNCAVGPQPYNWASKHCCKQAGLSNNSSYVSLLDGVQPNGEQVTPAIALFKSVYAYQFDDANSSFACPGMTSYTVTISSDGTPPPACTITRPGTIDPAKLSTVNGLTTAIINWQPSSTTCQGGITNYNVTVTPTAGGSPIFNQNVGNVLTATVPNIPAQTSVPYTVTVTASAGDKVSKPTAGTFTAPAFSAPVITKVKPGKHSATITWNASTDTYPNAGELNYFLAVGSNPPIEVGNPTGNSPVTDKVTHLAQGTYTATVYAMDAQGNSSAVSAPSESFTINGTPDVCKLTVPTAKPIFTKTSQTSGTLSWNPTKLGEQCKTDFFHYSINITPSLASNPGYSNSPTVSLSGIVAGQKYNVQIVANYNTGNVINKNYPAMHFNTAPTAQCVVSAGTLSPVAKATTANITWDPATPAFTGDCLGTPTYNAVITAVTPGAHVPGTYAGVSPWSISGLTSNANYSVAVTETYPGDGIHKKSSGSKTWSAPFNTYAPLTQCIVNPGTTNFTNVKSTSATIKWAAATPAYTGNCKGTPTYNVVVINNTDGQTIATYNGSSPWVVTKLIATSPSYDVRVTETYPGINKQTTKGSATWSATLLTNPAKAACAPQPGTTQIIPGADKATISWTPVPPKGDCQGTPTYTATITAADGAKLPSPANYAGEGLAFIPQPTGFSLNSAYKVTVAQTYPGAINKPKTTGTASWTTGFTTNTGACTVNPPTKLAQTAATHLSATIGWAGSTESGKACTGNIIYLVTAPPSSFSETTAVGAISEVITGLTAGNSYTATVVAQDGAYSSTPATVTVTTSAPKERCTLQAGTAQVTTGVHTANMTWTPQTPAGMPNCTGGTLMYTTTLQSLTGGKTPSRTYEGPDTSWSSSGYSADSSYTVAVDAVYTGGTAGLHPVVQPYPAVPFKTLAESGCSLTAPTMTYSGLTQNSVTIGLGTPTLSSNCKQNGTFTYSNVTLAPNNGNNAYTSSDDALWPLSGLTAGANYTLGATATYSLDGNPSVTYSGAFSTPAAPKQKCVMTAGTASLDGAPTQSSAEIQWTSVSTVNCSAIEISSIKYNVNVNGTPQTGVTSPLVLTNLNPATTYSVVISAVKGKENSPVTYNTVTFTTPAAPPPPPTFNISATWIGQFIVATWPSSSACSSSQVNLGSGMSLRTGPSVFGGMCQASMSVNDIRSGSYTFSVSQNSMQSNSVTCNASSKTCN